MADQFHLLREPEPDDLALRVETLGYCFKNPIGLAAGYDKDVEAVTALTKLGFGFVEVGTITPRPQKGNPRPRVFRLEEDSAVINRMGFNSAGLEACLQRLASRPRGDVVLGINVGINKENAIPERDYPRLIGAVSGFADYTVINVSSPNTPGLRDLQGETHLGSILDSINARMPERPPMLVKVSPDLSYEALAAVVETCVAKGVQGLVVSNTTVSRPQSLTSPRAPQTGGLSGAPLFSISTAMLARASLLADGRLTLIGTGGVRSGRDAFTKIKAGASLVQLYTGFAYAADGAEMVGRLKAELLTALREEGFRCVQDAVGIDAERLQSMT